VLGGKRGDQEGPGDPIRGQHRAATRREPWRAGQVVVMTPLTTEAGGPESR
jgi:hypothetical protein